MKYLVLSFDDNTIHDRHVVTLLNKYRLKGTFFINSGTLDKTGFIGKEEMKGLYKGHEVGSHSVNHLRMKELNKEEIKYEIEEDIEFIEAYSSQKVYGFAYPFGEYNKKIMQVLKELDIKYARTVTGTKECLSPKEFLLWHPTMHFSGMAYDSKDAARVEKGVKFMLNKVESFLDDPNAQMLHIWMHSWEFKEDKDRWDQLERLFRIISQEDDIVSVTAIEYYNKRNWHLKK